MITVPYTIQDIHGNVYPSAVVLVNSINVNENSQSNVLLTMTGGVENYTTTTNNSKNLNFQAIMYKDLAALNSNKEPMPLKDANGRDWHSFFVEVAPNTQEGWVNLVESHIETTILPQLQIEV